MEAKEQETAPADETGQTAEGEAAEDRAGVATAEAQDESSGEDAEPQPETVEDQLARLQQERDSYLDGLQRSRADLDNFRKRATQEKLQAASRGKADLLRALLPILDNMRLALQHAEEDADAVKEGVRMIWQQVEGFMRDQGIEPVATVGEPFDPAHHEALSTIPATDGQVPDTIVAEIKAGYVFDGQLLTPAQVVVARPAAPPDPATE